MSVTPLDVASPDGPPVALPDSPLAVGLPVAGLLPGGLALRRRHHPGIEGS